MKNKFHILINIANKRFSRRLKSKRKRAAKRRKTHLLWIKARESLGGDLSYENIINKWLPVNISYMLACENSDFHIEKVVKNIPENDGVFKVPKEFSIVDYPNESFKFIQNILGALVLQKYTKINIDYSDCKRVDLGAHNKPLS